MFCDLFLFFFINQEFLQRLFPAIQIEEEDYAEWEREFQEKAQEELSGKESLIKEKEEKITKLLQEIEDGVKSTDQLRGVLSETVSLVPSCSH